MTPNCKNCESKESYLECNGFKSVYLGNQSSAINGQGTRIYKIAKIAQQVDLLWDILCSTIP